MQCCSEEVRRVTRRARIAILAVALGLLMLAALAGMASKGGAPSGEITKASGR